MEHIIFELGVALVVMAVAARLALWARFPVIPFLIGVGMLVGPYAPDFGAWHLRLVTHVEVIEVLSRLGVLCLLVFLGLEFSVQRLVRAGRSILVGGSIYVVINFTLGLAFGWLLGWPFLEVLALAGITTISSSAIVAKVLVDLRRTANPETELILGIIMFEDVFLAIYLSVLSGMLLAGGPTLAGIALGAAKAFGFMVLVLVAGRVLTRWLDRWLNVRSDEVFLLMVLALLLVVAGFGETIHVAEAIGALLVGMVLAETEHAKRIEHMIVPLRDFCGAFFFFGFGLLVDYRTLGGAAGIALGAVAVTLFGNLLAGIIAGRLNGYSPRASTNVGLTIVSRGEFSVIVASLAAQGGLNSMLQPFAAFYVLVLAVLGPLITRESRWVYALLQPLFRRMRKRESDV